MPIKATERAALIYKFACEDGRRYIVYNASVIGNPADHIRDKWYVRSYAAPFPRGDDVGGPYDSADEAERAARVRHVEADGASSVT